MLSFFEQQRGSGEGGFAAEALRLAFLALAYFAATQVSLYLLIHPQNIASVWPPSGIALAALLLSEKRKWPRVLAVIFATNLLGNLAAGNILLVSLGFAWANIAESTLCAWALLRFCGPRLSFDRVLEIVILGLAALVINAFTALFGAAVPTLAFHAPYLHTWFTWLIADGLGIILVTPAIVAWARKPWPRLSWRPLGEGLLLALIVIWLAGSLDCAAQSSYPLLGVYLIFPFLLWSALRFDQRYTTMLISIFAIITICKTIASFALDDVPFQVVQGLVPMQLRIIVVTFTTLLISATISERRGSLLALHRSENNYRAFIEDTNDLITRVDAHGYLTFVNPMAEKYFGLPAAQCLGRLVFDFIHPDDRIMTRDWFRQCLADKLPKATVENRLMNCVSKEVFFFDWAVHFEFDPQGVPRHNRSIGRDITERKQQEQVQAFLSQTSSGYLAAPFFNRLACFLAQTLEMDFVCIDRLEGDGLTASPMAVWCDGRFEDNVSHALGDTPGGEVVGKELCSFPSQVRQLFPRDPLLRALRAESYVGVSLWSHSGRPIGLLAVIGRQPLANRQRVETILRMVAIRTAGEIERIMAEMELRESENRYAKIIAAVKNGLWEWDVREGNAFFCPIYYSLLGYEEQAFPASYDSWRLLIHPDDLARVEADLQQSIAADRFFSIDLRMKRKDGAWQWVSTRGSAVEWDGEGRVLRMVGTLSDISERKKMEAEKEKLQGQLHQAQKMESVGILAGGIAHDFNNILAAIMGYTEIAKDAAGSASGVVKSLDKVLLAAHRAKELVQQILAFSRQTSMERIPLDIKPLLKESLKMLRASLPATITVSEEIQPRKGLVLADPSQIHQVVMNLCINGYHAMEKTGGTLAVSLRSIGADPGGVSPAASLPPGEYVELTVSDSGTGIRPEIIDMIFDPYFTTKEIGKGTGMGLAIAHGIINGYGGAIVVNSLLGQGTTFRVYLPVIGREEEGKVAAGKEIPQGKGNILLIDDEAALVEVGQEILQGLGYTVTICRSGLEALQVFRNDPQRFDLVITDQTMLGMTGIDIAQRILHIRPEIPIILCTGYSTLVSEESAKAMGIRAFAYKPLSKATLGQMVGQLLAAATSHSGSLPPS